MAAENQTAVMTVTATDADLPAQTVTYSIVGGADQSKFSISTGGVLSFVTPPNFEVPTDVNGDNEYVLIVQASDGSLTTNEVILVTATNVNELSADFDGDDDVDGRDFLAWQRGFGKPNAAKTDGDADNDLDVDGADLGLWQLEYGTASPLVASSALNAEPMLSNSDLVDLALAEQLMRPVGQSSGGRTPVLQTPWLDNFTAEPIRWSDSAGILASKACKIQERFWKMHHHRYKN